MRFTTVAFEIANDFFIRFLCRPKVQNFSSYSAMYLGSLKLMPIVLELETAVTSIFAWNQFPVLPTLAPKLGLALVTRLSAPDFQSEILATLVMKNMYSRDMGRINSNKLRVFGNLCPFVGYSTVRAEWVDYTFGCNILYCLKVWNVMRTWMFKFCLNLFFMTKLKRRMLGKYEFHSLAARTLPVCRHAGRP